MSDLQKLCLQNTALGASVSFCATWKLVLGLGVAFWSPFVLVRPGEMARAIGGLVESQEIRKVGAKMRKKTNESLFSFHSGFLLVDEEYGRYFSTF